MTRLQISDLGPSEEIFKEISNKNLNRVISIIEREPSVLTQARNYYGETPLIYAINKDHFDINIFTYLLDNSDPDVPDLDKNTPLMHVIEQDYSIDQSEQIINLLLDHGANPHLENNNGVNVLELATEFGLQEIVNIILKKIGNEEQYMSSKNTYRKINNTDEECCICYGVFPYVYKHTCLNIFCENCIYSWLSRYPDKRCPMCRQLFGHRKNKSRKKLKNKKF